MKWPLWILPSRGSGAGMTLSLPDTNGAGLRESQIKYPIPGTLHSYRNDERTQTQALRRQPEDRLKRPGAAAELLGLSIGQRPELLGDIEREPEQRGLAGRDRRRDRLAQRKPQG